MKNKENLKFIEWISISYTSIFTYFLAGGLFHDTL